MSVFFMYWSLANVMTTEIIKAGGIAAIKMLEGSEASVNFGKMYATLKTSKVAA